MDKEIYTALLVNAWYTAQSLFLAQHGHLEDDDKERLFLDVLRQIRCLQKITGNEAGFKDLDKDEVRESVRSMLGIGKRP